jgi:hypothetical protein
MVISIHPAAVSILPERLKQDMVGTGMQEKVFCPATFQLSNFLKNYAIRVVPHH